MVRYRRNFVPGGTYFFTVVLADRSSTALIDHIAALRAAFRKTIRKREFSIDAIVVLPDHLHVVMTLPPGDADFSSRWKMIKGDFTTTVAASGRTLSRNNKGEYDLWQRRFWEHTIRDEGDFARHIDYIHFNPIKHRLVTHVRDWPHSSFHNYVRHRILPEDWAGTVDVPDEDFGEPQG